MIETSFVSYFVAVADYNSPGKSITYVTVSYIEHVTSIGETEAKREITFRSDSIETEALDAT